MIEIYQIKQDLVFYEITTNLNKKHKNPRVLPLTLRHVCAPSGAEGESDDG